MTTDENTGLIDLGDMSKLLVIARLKSRGQYKYATDIANDIEEMPAKAVANEILSNGHARRGNGTSPSPLIREIAQKIEASALRDLDESNEVDTGGLRER